MTADFALLMLVFLVITGLIWALDRIFGLPARRRAAEHLAASGASREQVEAAGREPVYVEYARAFFPVILVVFLLRAFVVEPFRIPSGSMLPTLRPGDFILVNKFDYGLRLPIINTKIIDIGHPHRGDVMVFRYPGNPSEDYIKRVIGLPGDHIVYRDKQLIINGKLMRQSDPRAYPNDPEGQGGDPRRVREDLDGVRHDIVLTDAPDFGPMEFTVPPNMYFVMGDNRDRSNDSRYWGYVPDRNLVGKAFMIWFSWNMAQHGGWIWDRIVWHRIGDAIH